MMAVARRARLARGHADRRRQVALLPGAGTAERARHRRRLAADLADERPGRRPARVRRGGGAAQQLAAQRRAARDRARCARRQDQAAVRLAGAPGHRHAFATCSGAPTCARSPSTKRTASATGATTSARSTASFAICARRFPRPRCTRTRPRRRRRCGSDIAEQLALRDPVVLVGDFDRPNLTYRVLPRTDEWQQVLDVVERHHGEAGIIYCIRRRDVDSLSREAARARGSPPSPITPACRRRSGARRRTSSRRRNAISSSPPSPSGWASTARTSASSCTPAMPKSIEHYQQESGRAGRDGLEAECVLLYSARRRHRLADDARARRRRRRARSRVRRVGDAPRARSRPLLLRAPPAATARWSSISASSTPPTTATPATSASAKRRTCPMR